MVVGNAGDSVDLLASGSGEVGYFGGSGGWVANGTVLIDAQNFAIYDYTTDGALTGDVLGSIAIDPDIALVNLNV